MADPTLMKILQQDSKVWNQWREERPDIEPDLRKADLRGKMLTGINFERTCLDGADLRNANLCSASLKSANLSQANLSGAKLRSAWLHRTMFKGTLLQQTNFHKALLLETLFLNVDLSEAINLKTVAHLGPSAIGIDTLQRSRGKVPDMFLRGAGVSEQLLTSLHPSGREPFDYATCFISYSSHDQHFVHILYQDLRNAGVLCWFAPESLETGEKFPASITAAVQSYQKVLVVISRHSLKSNWVKKEVELARQRERGGKREVLLPIRLDSAIQDTRVNWATFIRQQRNISSFENWQQPSRYQKMLKELLNDLRKDEKS